MGKRRGRGEGNIRQRKDGTWEARISLGHDGEGRRKTRSVYGATKREVQDKLRQLQDQAALGTLAEPTSVTLGEFLQGWLEAGRPSLSPSTYQRYESLVRVHIRPHLGGVRLSQVTPMHVQNLSAAIGREDGSAWTQRMSGTLLHNAMRSAVRLRLIQSNPAAGVPRARPGEREMRILTARQVRDLLGAARPERLFALFALALGTGMRMGELLGLSWDSVDLDAAQAKVHRSLAQVSVKGEPQRFVLKEPKSKRSKRTVRLPAFAVEALRAHRAAMLAEGHGSPFCFVTGRGTHIGKSNLTRQSFRRVLRLAGLPLVRFHDLRHSHASMLLTAGASIKAVSQRLGHGSVELTLRTYCHLLPDADETLAGLTDELVG